MKTVCIYHGIDLDGWMSAAIVKHWFLTDRDSIDSKYEIFIKEDSSSITKTINGQDYSLDFIGYNYGQPIPDLSEYDKVIMCDISFPKEEMLNLAVNKDFTWIDHHISAIKDNDELIEAGSLIHPKGRLDTTYSACELTWQHFFSNETMPEIVRLLGRYDCFGHKGTPEEQYVLEFQYGARNCISNYEEAYRELKASINYKNIGSNELPETVIWEDGRIIYQYLCTEAEQVYRSGFSLYLLNFETMQNYNFICINKERFNPINFGIDYHSDGYDGAACFSF